MTAANSKMHRKNSEETSKHQMFRRVFRGKLEPGGNRATILRSDDSQAHAQDAWFQASTPAIADFCP